MANDGLSWYERLGQWICPCGDSRGPWWWLRLRYRIYDELNPYLSGSLVRNLQEFYYDKVQLWMTPHLRWARWFLSMCREDNGTKLLDSGANYFYVRTRDEHQYYFRGWVSWAGLVTITRTQWLDKDREAHNLFLSGLLLGKDEEDFVPETVTVFRGRVLTRRQALASAVVVLDIPEFDWSRPRAMLAIVYARVGMVDKDEMTKLGVGLMDTFARELFPGCTRFMDLGAEDWIKVWDAIERTPLDELEKMAREKMARERMLHDVDNK